MKVEWEIGEKKGSARGGGVMGGEYNHSSFFCIMKRKNKKVKFKLKN